MAATAQEFDTPHTRPVLIGENVRLRVRTLRAADKAKLQRGFRRLSPESRYRRFLAYKRELTPEDLRFFTEFDGTDHYALGAFELDAIGRERAAVGVARFVRVEKGADVAEIAIAVVDDRQAMGVGRMLLERLLAAAAARGVRRIRTYVLAENERMLGLLRRFFENADFAREEGLLVGEFALPAPSAQTPAGDVGALFELLRVAAEGTVMSPLILGLNTFRQMLAHYRTEVRSRLERSEDIDAGA